MIRTLIFFVTVFAVSSCTNCWNCRQHITIMVDNEEIETGSYFEEDVCDKKQKESLERDGFVCAPQR